MIGFDKFVELLARRLNLEYSISEDDIRYTFFAAQILSGIQPERFILEFGHLEIPRAKIDSVILGVDGLPEVAIEFKYDKRNISKTSQPRPQKAGAAFADLARLALFPQVQKRLFVHLMDDELATYLSSPRNGLHLVFGLAPGESLEVAPDFFNGRSATFIGRLGEWPGRIRIKMMTAEPLPKNHLLKIFEVDAVLWEGEHSRQQ